ncbi:MAG: EF-Tu/IF-2/RF-3 family GTPase, partial [Patescibacteria group bacterium]
PVGVEANFKGIIDLFTRKVFMFMDDLGKDIKEEEVPAEMKEMVEEYRARLIEKIAENDEVLLNKFVAGEEIPIPDLKRVLRQAVINFDIVPILCGSALKNKGVQFMLDAVADYLPSPMDIPPAKAHDVRDPEKIIECHASDAEPFVALAFKIATDPFVGKIAYFRVYSGALKAGSYVLNAATGEKERIGRILRMYANHREDIEEVFAGEIAATVGLKNTFTGHTLCDPNRPVALETITFPEPVISIAVEPKTKADQEKMGVALQKLTEEDPTFKVKNDEETSQTIMWGMGELHLEILVDRMKREFKVEANVGRPQVAFKETIKGSAEAEGKYIHQSGGRGQYGHCWLRVEPNEKGKGYEFINELKGGVVPKEFIPPIQKGVKEALERGVLAG